MFASVQLFLRSLSKVRKNSFAKAHYWGSKQFQIVENTQYTVWYYTYYTTQADSIILKERYLAYKNSINCFV